MTQTDSALGASARLVAFGHVASYGTEKLGFVLVPFPPDPGPSRARGHPLRGQGRDSFGFFTDEPPALEAGSSGGATLKVFIHHFEPALNPYLRVP